MIGNPIVQYASLLLDIAMAGFYGPFRRGYDDHPPLNLSRYFWMASGNSQKLFEASILAFGKN